MPQLLPSLLSGFVIGATVAMPIGPMGILCIQRTLKSGLLVGLATGLGAATVHLLYSAVAVAGFSAIIQEWLTQYATMVRLLSGAILLQVAAKSYKRAIIARQSPAQGGPSIARAFISAISFGLANPLTVLLFLAAMQMVGGLSTGAPTVLGVFLGSSSWWLVLTLLVTASRSQFSVRVLALTNNCASLALAGFGVWILLRIV